MRIANVIHKKLDFAGSNGTFVIHMYSASKTGFCSASRAQRGCHLPQGGCVLCIETLTLLRGKVEALVKGVSTSQDVGRRGVAQMVCRKGA
jgi:hypothetical protein